MPSDRDPNQILIGAGRAGADSVGLNSLLFDAAALGQQPTASEVEVITPPTMDGENVQEIIDEYWALIPDRPNYIDEVGGSQFNDLNPVGWTFPSGFIEANYDDSGTAEPTIARPSATFTMTATLFPADRGVLAVKVTGSTTEHVSALNLGEVFVEGSVFSTSVPARILAQNDYTAGSDPDGTVGGVTQNIDLSSRVPMSRDFSNSAYPGVLYPYEDYLEDFQTFQLARADITVDLTNFANEAVTVEVVHYKTEDAFNAVSTNADDLHGIVDLAALYSPSNSATTFFYDDGTGDALSITSSSYSPGSGTTTPASAIQLSGVTYYGSSDSFDLDVDAEGMWDNAFLEFGMEFRPWNTDDVDAKDYNYQQYDTSGFEPDGDSAVLSVTDQDIITDRIGEATPVVRINDTTNASVSNTFNSLTYLWAYSGVVPSTDVFEKFTDESIRYPRNTALTATILPDGTGTTFDSTQNIADTGELQVGGIDNTGDFANAPGGSLKYPDTDYTTGYAPSGGQPDYSGISYDGVYLRSFDMGDSILTGVFTITGDPISASLLEDFQWDDSANFEGHSNGVKIEIAPSGLVSSWQDLGREFGDGNGAALSWTEPSPREVQVKFKLAQYPQLQSGFYPVAFKVTIFNGGPSQDLEFYSVELTPGI